MRSLARSARHVGALALARLLAALAGFVVTTLLARALGPSDYGRLAMLVALQGQALLLAELGLRSVVTADCGHDAGAVRRGLGRYFGLRLTLAALVAVAALPAAGRLVPGTGVAAAFLLSVLFASALFCDWIALARGRPLEAGLPLLARPLVAALALAAFGLTGSALSLETAAVTVAAGWWASALLSLAALRHLPPSAAGAPPAVSALLGRAVPLGLGGIAAQALLALDILLVGRLLGPAQAGQYQIAAGVLAAGLVFANAASQLALARSGRLRDRPAEIRRTLLSGLVATTALGLALATAAAVVGPLLLPQLFGDAYRPAAGLLFWFLPWFALQHPGSWLQGVLAALARERAVLCANVAALTVGLALFLAGGCLGDPRTVALGRGAAEASRILLLLAALSGLRRPASASAGPAAVMRAATSP